MALIKCPECGKEISDKAPACIHCGYPLQQVEEKKEVKYYKLILKTVGPEKVKTIKVVREVTNYGLKDAKDFVDGAPNLIAGGLDLKDAEKLQKMFSDLRNTAIIEEDTSASVRNDIFAKMAEYAKQREAGQSTNTDASNINRPAYTPHVSNVPKCLTCQSTNIQKISGLSKAGSVAMWGIFSQKVKKQWHCNNCGSEW